jgi:uncharacterized membrane-anchored protein YitT (DUF2179 family)
MALALSIKGKPLACSSLVSKRMPMESSRKNLLVALSMIVAGVAAFFLFLYLTGHDPDESPLTLTEWVIGGILIGPGFGYLIKWRRARDS